ncbi:MAG: hypothetical protein L0J45_00745 [Psychroflexus sp.]|nr:hypothetical protein [Psychroflexus sp.]MDN6310315.1 hypothetical protein [Psychroflexus sp.]
MKKLILTAVFAAATIGVSQANVLIQPVDTTIESTFQNEKEVKFSEVPQNVKDEFKADGHTEDQIKEIHAIETGRGLTEYKFLLEIEGKEVEKSYDALTK